MIAQPVITPVEVNGSEVATYRNHGDSSSQLVWRVYGPQDVDQAREICLAVLRATGGIPGETAAPVPVVAPVEVKRTRTVTAALRALLTPGDMTDDEVWAAVKVEFDLSSDKRYRIKEVKKELIAAGTIPAPAE